MISGEDILKPFISKIEHEVTEAISDNIDPLRDEIDMIVSKYAGIANDLAVTNIDTFLSSQIEMEDVIDEEDMFRQIEERLRDEIGIN